ncbi:hypothetical protein ZIOFF_026920 [Zingiber officinale]|uniref:Uncharacterized protein n=1 Tax=Zingiber officinale TaxID=94328 RepID=A0A8J5HH91_ZINOF|nr:hypothetical protein ZIOFF_026920 [Zingiber officinale]
MITAYTIYIILQILDEMPVFYNLNAIEKREVLIVILQIIRNLDDPSLVKAWQQSIARTRLFFKLLEECLIHFEVPLASWQTRQQIQGDLISLQEDSSSCCPCHLGGLLLPTNLRLPSLLPCVSHQAARENSRRTTVTRRKVFPAAAIVQQEATLICPQTLSAL